MKKVYAKNPGEIILDNPAKKKKKKLTKAKDPRRVAAGKKAYKTRMRRQNQSKTKTMSKKDDNIAEVGKDMFYKYGLTAVGTIASVKGLSYLLNRFGGNLPAAYRQYAMILIPAGAGVVIGAKGDKKNVPLQGIAGGMVYAAVSQAMQKFLPSEVTDTGLNDALGYNNSSFLGDIDASSLIVTPDGRVFDLQGNLTGNARMGLPAGKEKKAPEVPQIENARLDDAFGGDWEKSGESYGL